jgi:hypothetical protein
MNKFLLGLTFSLVAIGFSGTAHAASGKEDLASLAAPGGATAQSITGAANFSGNLRVVATTCSDVRVGRSINSGFRFTGYGNRGVAQFSGVAYQGSIRGSEFRGRAPQGQMGASFTGARGRVTGARVAIILQAASGCRIGLSGIFRVR